MSFANAQILCIIGVGFQSDLNSTRLDSTTRQSIRSFILIGIVVLSPSVDGIVPYRQGYVKLFDKILSNSSTYIVGLNSLLLKQLTTACICEKMEAKRFQSHRKRNTCEYKDIQGRFQLCDFSARTDILPPEKTERSDILRRRKLPLHR